LWLSGDKIIGIDTETKVSYDAGDSLVTGNFVVGKAMAMPSQISTESDTTRLELLRERVNSGRYVRSPRPLLNQYLKMYPSRKVGLSICGDNVCDQNEQCSIDCETACEGLPSVSDVEKTQCLEKNGEWRVNEIINGCPIPAYCIFSGEEELSETKILALLMKLENLQIKIGELAHKAGKLSEYYEKNGDLKKYEIWKNAQENFFKMTGEIEVVRSSLKGKSSPEIKDSLQELVKKIKNSLTEVIIKLIEVS